MRNATLEANRLLRRSEERLAAIHRFAETNAGGVKMLKGPDGDKRLRVGDFRVRFSETDSQIRIHSVKNRRDAYR